MKGSIWSRSFQRHPPELDPLSYFQIYSPELLNRRHMRTE